MTKNKRRAFLTGAAAVGAVAAAKTGRAHDEKPAKKVHWKDGKRPEKTPLFSGITSYGGLVFVAGIGAHFEGDIKAHTKHVLDEIQQRLESVGSSMDKVVKCNVYLRDIKDFAAMNEVYKTYFKAPYPARTTIQAGALPVGIAVEIECVARK